MTHRIPEFPVQYGGSWMQPDRYDILLSDTEAMMSVKTFGALMDYTGDIPSLIHSGKMWRIFSVKNNIWFLYWAMTAPGKSEDQIYVNCLPIKIYDWKALLGVP